MGISMLNIIPNKSTFDEDKTYPQIPTAAGITNKCGRGIEIRFFNLITILPIKSPKLKTILF